MSIPEIKNTNTEVYNSSIFNENTDQLVFFKKPLDKRIYEYLIQHGNVGKTRDQISNDVYSPRSSVYDALKRMTLLNLIEYDYKRKSKSRKGRPFTVYYVKNSHIHLR